MTHTPGPWIIDPNPDYPLAVIEDNEDGNQVCCEFGSGHESKANALLTAAAPSMLKSLQLILFATTTDQDVNDGAVDIEAIRMTAEVAIANAIQGKLRP